MKLILIVIFSLSTQAFYKDYLEEFLRSESLETCGLNGSTWEKINDCHKVNNVKRCGQIPTRKESTFSDNKLLDEWGKDCINRNIKDLRWFIHWPKHYVNKFQVETKKAKEVINMDGFLLVTVDRRKRIYWLDLKTGIVWSPIMDGQRYLTKNSKELHCKEGFSLPSKKQLIDVFRRGFGEVLQMPFTTLNLWTADANKEAFSLETFKMIELLGKTKQSHLICVNDENTDKSTIGESYNKGNTVMRLMIQ
jgi:hypothetical protein